VKYILRAFNSKGWRVHHSTSQDLDRLIKLADDLRYLDGALVITIERGDRLIYIYTPNFIQKSQEL